MSYRLFAQAPCVKFEPAKLWSPVCFVTVSAPDFDRFGQPTTFKFTNKLSFWQIARTRRLASATIRKTRQRKRRHRTPTLRRLENENATKIFLLAQSQQNCSHAR